MSGHRRPDGTLEPKAEEIEIVRECFRRRLAGESHMAIRGWLREQGVDRSPRGVQQLLSSPIVLGELRFGDLENLHAHEPIVDRELFAAVQRMRVPRGPQPKSDRLLARLRVVRCGTCGSALGTMVMPRQGDYAIYRCGSHNDCDKRVTIAAVSTEDWVWARVKERLADAQGRATAGEGVARLGRDRDRAQERLDLAVRSLGAAGLLSEPASVETLSDLRAERDRRQEALDDLPPTAGLALTVRVDDDLPVGVRRDLIRATVRAVTVAPSGPGGPRGVDRLSIEFH